MTLIRSQMNLVDTMRLWELILQKKILDSKKKVEEYVNDIPHTLNSLVVGRMEYTDIEKIISALPAKNEQQS